MDKYLNAVKDNVSDYRYKHILGVYEMATQIATKFNLPLEKCQIAAILHDVTKDDSVVNTKEHISELTDDSFVIAHPKLWHAFTGSNYAHDVLNIVDDEILEAIMFHSIGKKDLSVVGRVVFISDAIEKNRTNTSSVDLRNQFLNDDISFSDLFLQSCEIKMKYGLEKNISLHPNLKKMYESFK